MQLSFSANPPAPTERSGPGQAPLASKTSGRFAVAPWPAVTSFFASMSPSYVAKPLAQSSSLSQTQLPSAADAGRQQSLPGAVQGIGLVSRVISCWLPQVGLAGDIISNACSSFSLAHQLGSASRKPDGSANPSGEKQSAPPAWHSQVLSNAFSGAGAAALGLMAMESLPGAAAEELPPDSPKPRPMPERNDLHKTDTEAGNGEESHRLGSEEPASREAKQTNSSIAASSMTQAPTEMAGKMPGPTPPTTGTLTAASSQALEHTASSQAPEHTASSQAPEHTESSQAHEHTASSQAHEHTASSQAHEHTASSQAPKHTASHAAEMPRRPSAREAPYGQKDSTSEWLQTSSHRTGHSPTRTEPDASTAVTSQPHSGSSAAVSSEGAVANATRTSVTAKASGVSSSATVSDVPSPVASSVASSAPQLPGAGSNTTMASSATLRPSVANSTMAFADSVMLADSTTAAASHPAVDSSSVETAVSTEAYVSLAVPPTPAPVPPPPLAPPLPTSVLAVNATQLPPPPPQVGLVAITPDASFAALNGTSSLNSSVPLTQISVTSPASSMIFPELLPTSAAPAASGALSLAGALSPLTLIGLSVGASALMFGMGALYGRYSNDKKEQ